MSGTCRGSWGVATTLQGLAAVAWAWGMAQGFPADHPQFFSHLALPTLAAGLSLASAAALVRGVPSGPALGLVVPGLWLGLGLGLLIFWPATGWPGLLLLGGGAALASSWIRCWAALPIPRAVALAAALAGLGSGLAFPALERAGVPSTRPANPALPAVLAAEHPAPARIAVAPDVDLFPAEPSVSLDLNLGEAHMEIRPLLSFVSTSPDGGWTLFAPQTADDRSPARATAHPVIRADYGGPHPSSLSVSMGDDIEVDTWTRLPQAVYSHLNTYTHLMVYGMARPRLAVAGLPPVAVAGFEQPATFAWLDPSRGLVLSRAESKEKGPFQDLSSAPLTPGDPLEIVFLDGDRTVATVRWLDWSAQAGSALSPTAGWGVPVNAVEWRLDESGAAHVFLTLAGTSIGRGWNSVGHAPGTYRNRLQIIRPSRP